jgi:transcriptional regulator with XRE-family HTH domain
MSDSFAENLRFLCSHSASVAEVCRRIGINRQQFNKYLSGASTPSMNTLRRICDFFGVDEAEIFLAPRSFADIVQVKRAVPSAASPLVAAIEQAAALFPDSQEKLRKYCGFYFAYMCTPAYPGMILKFFTAIFQSGDHTFAKAIERLVDKRHPERGSYISKYQSLVMHTADRIYVMDHNPLSHQVFALSVLYPSHRNRLHLLSGLGIAVSGGPGRQAFATRMVYEYLGETTDLRAGITSCGLYPDDTEEIDAAIKSRIGNEIRPDENTLCAVEF